MTSTDKHACECGHDHEHNHHLEDHCGCGHDHEQGHRQEHNHHHENHGSYKVYLLENLGCANCAAKMETKINALP